MTTLKDVLGVDLSTLLSTYIGGGWVRQQHHPTEYLAILNYTEQTAFEKKWDRVTLNCRGLIYNTDTLEVVARPFSKFFNFNEGPAPKFDLDEKVIVTDKQDGSLGILYREPSTGRAAIATRGSFTSPQALHATELLRTKYQDWLRIYETVPQSDVPVTLCFEIVFPENRIVLNYGDTDDLVLLGGVEIDTGKVLSPNVAKVVYAWPGPKTHIFGFMSFGEALAMTPRENAEGIVVRAAEDNRMVKIKQEDYVILHRLVTNLTERSVWEALVSGIALEEFKKPLPEEFWPWVDAVAGRLESEVYDEYERLWVRYREIRTQLGLPMTGDRTDHEQKKLFAHAVAHETNKWAFFLFAQSGDQLVIEKLWKKAKPEAVSPHEQ